MKKQTQNLYRYILPTVAGSTTTFLYVIVDGIFVGRGIGVDALGAVNLAVPFTLMANAFAILLTIGGTTVTAIRLGREDVEGANNAFMHSATMAFLLGIIFMTMGMIFAKKIAELSGANNTFSKMTEEYLFYVSAFSLPLLCNIILQGFVRNDGAPILVSAAVISGAVINIFFDWLFVFPFKMGVKGAAIASGLGQAISFLILINHFIHHKGRLRIRIKQFSISSTLIKKIILRGLPEMISQMGMPIMTLCMNYILIRQIGDISVSAFSIITYLTSFSLGIFMGVSEGLQPLLGQSYGRRNENDLKYYFNSGMVINVSSAFTVFSLLFIFKKSITMLFNSDLLLIQTTTKALTSFSWAFMIMSANLLTTTFFYSTKQTKYAVIIACSRCLLITPLAIFIMPIIFGNGIIWYTVGTAEFLTLIIAFFLLRNAKRKDLIKQSLYSIESPQELRRSF